jgi:hypothetical protein
MKRSMEDEDVKGQSEKSNSIGRTESACEDRAGSSFAT